MSERHVEPTSPATLREYAALVASHGASYYWKMDEASGNFIPTIGSINLNATSVAYRQPGKFGTDAAFFNGTTAHAETASAVVLSGGQRCVIEAIANISAHKGSNTAIWEFGPTLGVGWIVLFDDGGLLGSTPLSFIGGQGNVGLNYHEALRLPVGKTCHLAHVVDISTGAAQEHKLYVDGTLRAIAGSQANSNNTGNLIDNVLNVGARNAGASLFTRLTMQHLAVYTGANSTLAQINERAAYVARFLAPSSGRDTSTARTATP